MTVEAVLPVIMIQTKKIVVCFPITIWFPFFSKLYFHTFGIFLQANCVSTY